MYFASDNSSPAHPAVLDALYEANHGYTAGYGAEEAMGHLTEEMRKLFEAPEASIYLVATGTAANALALATLTKPWEVIYCHHVAHIEEDECGAPEFYTNGAKLVLIDGQDGRMDAQAFEEAVTRTGQIGVHNVQRGTLSLTNLTELGTTYSLEELAQLTEIASRFQVPVHLDGARFANALLSLDARPADMTWKIGVDAVSFGGTKNGLLGVEAVIIFDPEKAWEFELRRKRGGHLLSKHRLLSAQMAAYLKDDLWLHLAKAANSAAAQLELGLIDKNIRFAHQRDANMIFAALPKPQIEALRKEGAMFYDWNSPAIKIGDEKTQIVRLVTSWSTTEDEIARFLSFL